MNELPKSVDELSPQIADRIIIRRSDPTNYHSTGTGDHTKAPDVMLELEWQGKRYLIPAFLQS